VPVTTDRQLTEAELAVEGMTCGTCAARVEKTLTRQPGVAHAAVNFATGRAVVAYDPRAVTPAGLGRRGGGGRPPWRSCTKPSTPPTTSSGSSQNSSQPQPRCARGLRLPRGARPCPHRLAHRGREARQRHRRACQIRSTPGRDETRIPGGTRRGYPVPMRPTGDVAAVSSTSARPIPRRQAQPEGPRRWWRRVAREHDRLGHDIAETWFIRFLCVVSFGLAGRRRRIGSQHIPVRVRRPAPGDSPFEAAGHDWVVIAFRRASIVAVSLRGWDPDAVGEGTQAREGVPAVSSQEVIGDAVGGWLVADLGGRGVFGSEQRTVAGFGFAPLQWHSRVLELSEFLLPVRLPERSSSKQVRAGQLRAGG